MSLENTAKLIENINHAPSANLAAHVALDWLVNYVGAAAFALHLQEDAQPEVILRDDKPLSHDVLTWLRNNAHWQGLTHVKEAPNPLSMLVPLRYGGYVYGVLWQSFPDEQVWARHEQAIQMLMGIVAARVYHLHTLSSNQEMDDVVNALALQTARLSASTSVSKVIISQKDDIHAMLHTVTELICYRFGFSRVQVYLLAEDRQSLQTAMDYTENGPRDVDENWRLPLTDRSLLTWAVNMDEVVLANDITQHTHYRADLHPEGTAAQLILPLRSGTQMMGAMAISCNHVGAFDSSDVEIMQSIADQLAVGINNTRLFSEVRARAQDLSALTEISLLVNATLDIDQLAERVYTAFSRLQNPDVFQFVVFDRFDSILKIETFTESSHTSERRAYLPQRDLLSQIIEQTTPVFWRSEHERQVAGTFFHIEQARFASFLGVPMVSKDNVMGVLCSHSVLPNAFNDNALQVMLTFASSAAVAIENADLFDYTARRVQELAIINEISHLLARSFGDDNVWALVHRQIASLFQQSAMFVALLDDSGTTLTFPLVSDTKMELHPHDPIPLAGLCRAVVEAGHMLLFEDLQADQSQLKAMNMKPNPHEPGFGARSWLGVPLLNSEGGVIGLIVVFSKQPSQYDDQDSSLLMTITAQLSLSLENARLFKSEQGRRHMADTLIEVGQVVTSSLERDSVLDTILEQIKRVVDYDGATILLQAPGVADASEMTIAAMRGEINARPGMRIYFNDASFNMKVYRTGKPMIVADAQQEENFNGRFDDGSSETATRSWICVPMLVQDRFVGFITIDKFEPDYYTQRDADMVFALARQAAIAVENARLFTAEQKRRRMADTLIEVGQVVASSLDRDDVLETILEQIKRVVDYDGTTLMLQAPGVHDASEMIVAAKRGKISAYPGMRIYFDEDTLNMQVYNTGKPMIVDDVQQDPGFNGRHEDGNMELHTRSWICVPMLVQERFVGFITVDKFQPRYYTQRDANTVFALARQAAIAVENARLFEAEQERRKVADSLIDVGRVVASTLDRDEVMTRILDQLWRVVAYDGASIIVSGAADDNPDATYDQLVATRGAVGSSVGSKIRYHRDHPIRSIHEHHRVVIIPDVREHGEWYSLDVLEGPFELLPIRSWMGVPMLVQERLIGVITLDHYEPNAYSKRDAETAFALARQAAVAIENAQLHEHQKARAKRVATLHRIASVISTKLDSSLVMEAAASLLADLFDATNCTIALANKSAPDMVIIAYPQPRSMRPVNLAKSALYADLMNERVIVSLDQTTQDPTRQVLEAAGLQKAMLAPLIAKNTVIGLIGLEVDKPEDILQDVEQHQTFAAIANQVAVAIYNAELYEEALTANRLKGEFLANISHELRTPLNAILGYTDMLLDQIYGDLNDKQEDRVFRVNRSGKHLLALINDVLDLSKIEAGRLELEFNRIGIKGLVQDTLLNITPQIEEKGLALELTISDNLPVIEGDPIRIQQVLTNLLSNAVKFTDEGMIGLDVQTVWIQNGIAGELDLPPALEIPDGDWLAITVEDSGMGIRPEHQSIIFDAFRQADGSPKRKHQGTGLGLAISRQIVEMHGGFIWVNSQPGDGSEFTVLLPLDSETQANLITAAHPVIELEGGSKGQEAPAVVVIEDDDTTLQLIQDYLSEQAYRVICTNNPEHGLSLVHKHQPAAILLDIRMPGIDGLSLLKMLKENPETALIPVGVLSMLEYREEAMELGAAAYITKPVNQSRLLQMVASLTQHQHGVEG